MDLLISPESVMLSHRYDEEELPFIETLIKGATSYLKTAGAYDPNNELTETALHLIVGHWLDNRDLLNTDYVKTGEFPINITGIIKSLQYSVCTGE